jgi:hypothetical protein
MDQFLGKETDIMGERYFMVIFQGFQTGKQCSELARLSKMHLFTIQNKIKELFPSQNFFRV